MIHPTVKILKGSQICGKVNIGNKSSVWYNAVIRGDIEDINIGEYSNIQDNCVIHTSKNYPVRIGSFVSVGHASVIHGAMVEDNCLIGINATLLNGCVIGKNSLVGAGAVVTPGKKFPPGRLIMGMPAKEIRKLDQKEIESILETAIRYSKLADKH